MLHLSVKGHVAHVELTKIGGVITGGEATVLVNTQGGTDAYQVDLGRNPEGQALRFGKGDMVRARGDLVVQPRAGKPVLRLVGATIAVVHQKTEAPAPAPAGARQPAAAAAR